jgi:uroporphyrinogen-III synthase
MQVVVTRPAGDAPGWMQGLAVAGFSPWLLPLIDVLPVPDPSAMLDCWQRVGDYQALMFVSGNAVAHFYASKPPEVPVDIEYLAIKTRAWATGPGTVRALQLAGVWDGLIDAPLTDSPQFDTEALWAVVQSQVQPTSRILIVRGAQQAQQTDGGLNVGLSAEPVQTAGAGRDWFAAQLLQAGAQVDVVVAYQRGVPVMSDLQKTQAQAAAVDGSVWLFSSSEAIANLQQALPQQSWGAARAVATHSRIAAKAKQAGFGVVCESRPALSSVVASIESIR